MKKAIKIIIRLIVTPLFSGIALIHSLTLWITYTLNFIWHGGEAIAFTKKFQSKAVTEVLEQLVDRLDKEKASG